MTEVAVIKGQRSDSANSPQVRILYPWHFNKRTKSAAGRDLRKPRNDCTLLFPKLNADPGQCANYAFLAGLCMQAASRMWPSLGGQFPQGGHWPIQDGDKPMTQAAPKPGVAQKSPEELAKLYAWRKGNWIVEVTHYLDPGPKIAKAQNGAAIELPMQTINGQEMFKSGDYGLVHMHAYAFQNEKFGCNFGYEGVLYTAEGERIGGGPRSAATMFAGAATFGAVPAPQSFAPPPPLPPGVTATVAPAYHVPGSATPMAPPAPQPQAPGNYAPPPAPPAPQPQQPAPMAPPPTPPGGAPLPPFPTR